MKLTSFYIKQKGWRSLQHPHQEPKMFLCSSFFFGLTFSIILEVKMSEWSITAGHEILCAIWFHLHNLKNVKNIHRGMISVTPPWLFFTFFKLFKWYQIAYDIWHELNSRNMFVLRLGHMFFTCASSLDRVSTRLETEVVERAIYIHATV